MIDCIRKHEEILRLLPWWRKDYYGWPIETYVGKPIKSFCRLVCINLKKPFQAVYWWWRCRKGPGKFETMALPAVKNVSNIRLIDQITPLCPDEIPPPTCVFPMDYVYSEKGLTNRTESLNRGKDANGQ